MKVSQHSWSIQKLGEEPGCRGEAKLRPSVATDISQSGKAQKYLGAGFQKSCLCVLGMCHMVVYATDLSRKV